VSLQHTFTSGLLWEPLYRWEHKLHPVEIELFQSTPVRRLKYLHHFGASALFSPLVHSRLEHTIGVWSLTAHFFPDDLLQRIAAIVHDIGHLPFSHAVERTLGFDHHARTVQLIESGSIAELLMRHDIQPSSIVQILGGDSSLTSKAAFLGLDHMDSFLRDTHAAGKTQITPHKLVRSLRFRGNFIEANIEDAEQLIEAMVEDHHIFLKPEFLAMDALLAKAVSHHCEAHIGARSRIPSLVDHELIVELQRSDSPITQDIMRVLMQEPHKIAIHNEPIPGSIQVNIKKLYSKQPLVNGLPATEQSQKAASKLAELDNLTATYFFTYS
jgi:HD superfamily phosphohydrolase